MTTIIPTNSVTNTNPFIPPTGYIEATSVQDMFELNPLNFGSGSNYIYELGNLQSANEIYKNILLISNCYDVILDVVVTVASPFKLVSGSLAFQLGPRESVSMTVQLIEQDLIYSASAGIMQANGNIEILVTPLNVQGPVYVLPMLGRL